MWDRLAAIAPVKPASLAAPPAPRLRGAAIGPLAGGGGSNALVGGSGGDTMAAEPMPPTPRIRPVVVAPSGGSGNVVDRKPIVRIGSGVRNFAEDLSSGLSRGDPSAPPISAFGQGLFGAIASGRDRAAAEVAAANAAEDRRIAAEDRAYERERDLATDARLERETDAKIEGGYWKGNKGATQYVNADGTLTAEGVKEVYGFVNDEVDSLRNFYQQSGLIRRSNAAEIEAKINEYATQYRKDLEETIRAGGLPLSVPRPVDKAAAEEAAAAGAPKPGGPATAPAPAAAEPAAPSQAAKEAEKPGGEAVAVPPAGYTGAGTVDSPFAGGKGPPPGMKPGQVWTDGVNLYEQE